MASVPTSSSLQPLNSNLPTPNEKLKVIDQVKLLTGEGLIARGGGPGQQAVMVPAPEDYVPMALDNMGPTWGYTPFPHCPTCQHPIYCVVEEPVGVLRLYCPGCHVRLTASPPLGGQGV